MKSAGLVLRQQTVNIWNRVYNGNKTLLTGPKGIGKSATLLQIAVAAASDRDILVVYCPSLGRATAGYYGYTTGAAKGMFDQPDLAKEILATFSYLNGRKLTGPIKEILGAPLSPVVILENLLSHLPSCGQKAILALDQVNALYCTTQYADQKGVNLRPAEMTVLKSLIDVIEKKDSGITVVAAQCNVDPLIRSPTVAFSDSFDSHQVELKPFSVAEVQALLAYYRELGHSYEATTYSPHLIQFVSGGLPARIKEACNYETMYSKKPFHIEPVANAREEDATAFAE